MPSSEVDRSKQTKSVRFGNPIRTRKKPGQRNLLRAPKSPNTQDYNNDLGKCGITGMYANVQRRGSGWKKIASQSTVETGYWYGQHLQRTLPYLPTVYLYKSVLCEVETRRAVDGGIDYPCTSRRAGQLPASATVRRVPHNTGRAADERVGGKIAERRVVRHETVRSV